MWRFRASGKDPACVPAAGWVQGAHGRLCAELCAVLELVAVLGPGKGAALAQPVGAQSPAGQRGPSLWPAPGLCWVSVPHGASSRALACCHLVRL